MRLRSLSVLVVAAALFPVLGGSSSPRDAEPEKFTGTVDSREHLRRGMELARQGLHDGAVAEFRRSIELYPKDPDAHFYLGRSLLELAKKQRAALSEVVREMEEALRLDPYRDYVRAQLADVYCMRMPNHFNPDKAVALFEELIARHTDRFEIRLRYAACLVNSEVRLARSDDPNRVPQDSAWTNDMVRFQVEKVLDQAPRDSEQTLHARLLLTEVLFRSGEWDQARAILEDMVTSYADRGLNLAPYWNTIGHCHWRRGDYKKAVEAFRKACDITPTLPFLWDLRLAFDMLGGYPKDLPERYRFPLREENYDRASPPNLKFTDIAPKLHINRYAGAGPASWLDYNGDGKFDLLACGCDTFCNLYRAQGDTFVDATVEAGLAKLEPGFGAPIADYDGDGDYDIYIARNGWNGPAANGLMKNNGDGTFTDVGAAAGAADKGSSFNGTWFDYDRDGRLDLVITNGVYLDNSTNQLYRNRGDGTFANVTAAAGLTEAPFAGTIGVAVGDYDDDGWLDIFYHGRMEPNRLYHNNRDGTFTDMAARAGVVGPGKQNGYIAFFADFDSDGDLDIWTGSLAPWEQVLAGYRPDYKLGSLDDLPRFYRNNGDGTFADNSLTSGFRYPHGIMAAGVGDLDNDGYLDIYLGTGNPELRRLEPNNFYHNRGGRTFEDLSRFTGLGCLGKGHGITFLDWDGDGDLEVYKELGGFFHGDFWENRFYLNEAGNKNNWLQVRLQQPGKNHDAVGARVTIKAGSLNQTQQVIAGRGFGSTDPPTLHFGLGQANKVERLQIRWPDDTRQVMESLPVNRYMLIKRTAPASH